MGKLFKTYLLISGLIAHIVVASVLLFALWIKLHDHWRVNQFLGWFQESEDTAPTFTSSLDSLPINRWTKVHQMNADDAVTFKRQIHSGSAFDQKRNRLLIFGSDTHGRNWDNRLYAFDLNTLSWTAISAQESLPSYTVSPEGVPIAAGDSGITPWAMHTFDSITYDPIHDQLVVASQPNHLKPGRFKSPIDKDLWARITTHPTWGFDFSNQRWKILVADKPAQFFSYASAYSQSQQSIFGFRPSGVFQLSRNTQTWDKVAKSRVKAYHTQAVWDERNQAFVIAGSQKLSNDIHIYRPGENSTSQMPTPGTRPPGFQHSPMAYHESSGAIALVIDSRKDGKDMAETWLYRLKDDQWKVVPDAGFSFHLGMNYHMQYSRALDALVLVLQTPKSQPSVWLLRLKAR